MIPIIHFFTKKGIVKKEDIYGKYVIDRTKYSGKQSDWQYNHFQFEITKQNQFIFYQTEYGKILDSDTINIEFLEVYSSHRVKLVGGYRHHIIQDNPTLFRNVWSFYYVFHSPKFGNLFFKKGKWKNIN